MKALSSTLDGKKYLQISRSDDLNLEEIRTSRRKILPLFESMKITRLLSDVRNVDFDGVNAVDIYVLIKDFLDDFPDCKRIALIADKAPSNLLHHYESASAYYGVELSIHGSLEEARAWLCSD